MCEDLPSVGKFGVPTDPSFRGELRFTVSHQIDRSWNDVKIAQEEDDSSRKKTVDSICDNLSTYFEDLDITQFVAIESLVGLFIKCNSFSKVRDNLVLVNTYVVGR